MKLLVNLPNQTKPNPSARSISTTRDCQIDLSCSGRVVVAGQWNTLAGPKWAGDRGVTRPEREMDQSRYGYTSVEVVLYIKL
jgi:hypothetical protein